jgi:hypothetical protein
MNFAGDIQIRHLSGPDAGDYDIVFELGQPIMSGSFDSYIYLAVYGDKKTWQNLIAQSESGRIISDFPDVINNAPVSDDTKNNGTAAIKRALEAMVTDGIAGSVTVKGEILSVYAIAWSIEIARPTGAESYSVKYSRNWNS